MANQWGLGIQLIYVTIFLIAATTNICLGAPNITLACFEHERLALLEFKESVQDTFQMLSSWVGNDCCEWERVQCDVSTGHVESLHLRGNEEFLIANDVKASLTELSHLKYLDVSGNNFQGSRIPDFLGSFQQLTYLNLSNSDFYGNIPHHIGNLSNLKVLDLNYFFSLQVLMVDDMTWIYGLSSLKYLDLSYVDLSGAENHDIVPYTIPLLEELRLAGCGISKNIYPFNLSAAPPNIKHLDLGFNYFEGLLPSFFQNMSSLEFLDLSNFDLSLRLWNFANLLEIIPSLQEVHLSYCNLQNMHLSPTFINFTLSNIRVLDLSYNSFERNFPFIVTNLSSLRVLDLSYCELNSTIPIMPNLLDLDLSGNKFKQIDHLEIWRRCHLKQLSVSSNYFDIELLDSHSPTEVSECSQYALERLYLDGSFNGIIPKSHGRLTKLRGLDLSRNGLTGPIPESLERLRLLEVLNLSYNQLNGSIPESLRYLTSLQDLILNSNHLTGSIPTSLGELVSLKTFSISSNFLNGIIPVPFWQLTES